LNRQHAGRTHKGEEKKGKEERRLANPLRLVVEFETGTETETET